VDPAAEDHAWAVLGDLCRRGLAEACHDAGMQQGGEWQKRPAFRRAVELWDRACSAGDGDACESLANAYESGEGVRVDVVHALELHTIACDLGSLWACDLASARAHSESRLPGLQAQSQARRV
jgi:TPR repeat protein